MQFTMELDGTESGNSPKSYCMDMYTDFVPMSVFSESSKGKHAFEIWSIVYMILIVDI